MNILYIAYSCMPEKGSEEKIGWSVPLESAKHHSVFVITKIEHKEKIESYIKEHNIKNIKFFYADINPLYKKVCKGFFYSVRLNVWQKKALKLAKEISKKEKIDIIHQITPVEFRSIGRYGEIENTKFVCGPLGGGEYCPEALKVYTKSSHVVELTRKAVNVYTKVKYKAAKRFRKCDYLLFCNEETRDYLSPLCRGIPSELYSEIGIGKDEIVSENVSLTDNKKLTILLAGRLVYRKGHSFLLDVLSTLPEDLAFECRIVGDGPDKKQLTDKMKKLGLEDKVLFTGKLPFTSMNEEYQKADVLVMPSLRETTGSVLLEAMAQGKPVITIGRYGGKVLLDSNTAYLYDGNTLNELKESLRAAILNCAMNPEERKLRGEAMKKLAHKNTWEEKIDHYNSIYKSLLKD